MDRSGDAQTLLRVEDVEAAVQEQQRTPGGLRMNIVLSPAISKSAPRTHSHIPYSPHTQAEIDEKLSAATSRKEMLDNLRVKNIASQLARVDEAKQKREEINTEKSVKSKEMLETKLEVHEKNRTAQLQYQREKLTEKLARVERAHKELEIQTEAARVAAACTINAKLSKAQEKREEHLEEMIAKMKEHEKYVHEVRESHERLFSEDKDKVEAELNVKMEKAAKERERKEHELKAKLDERNKHAEIVRRNKEKMDTEGNTAPESV